MFQDIDGFVGLAALRDGWREVRAELDALDGQGFLDWPERFIYDGDWSVFPFHRFGEKIASTCAACPRTTVLVEGVAGMVTAAFSKLAPGTEIAPHCGYTDEVLRFHLGLTQADGCGIRVGDQTAQWAPGSAFVFDDTLEHAAWNRGPSERVILLLDFKRDPSKPVSFPAHVLAYGGEL